MKPAAFEYAAPETTAEALALLAEYGSDARIIAGGQTLGPMLNMRMVTPTILVDINRITDLPAMTVGEQKISTPALARQREVHESGAAANALPVLRKALSHVGHFQTRTRGTICGSIAHADPTAELPLLLLTLGGSVSLASKKQRRTIGAADFFQGALTTARRPEELIVGVDWPVTPSRTRYSFEELTVRHGHIAISSCAARLRLTVDGSVADIAIGVAGISDRPILLPLQAGHFTGVKPDEQWLSAVIGSAERLPYIDDLHASAAYRKSTTAYLIGRSVRAMLNETGNQG